MKQISIEICEQGWIYQNKNTLPKDARMIGIVKRDFFDRGALVELSNGVLVQMNANVIRNLPSEIRKLIHKKHSTKCYLAKYVGKCENCHTGESMAVVQHESYLRTGIE